MLLYKNYMSDQKFIKISQEEVGQEGLKFVFATFSVFLISYTFLAWIDFLPETVKDKNDEKILETKEEVGVESSELGTITFTKEEEMGQLPEKITFNTLNRSVTVLNPTSKSIQDLDNALLSGVVRHPDSAILGQPGTVFLLGHSSYLPKVINKNFQAFNEIQNLKWGDTITIESDTKVYVYRVSKVYKAQATDTTVPIAGTDNKLVLATCNSFGTVDDRYIVEASLMTVDRS